MKMHKHHIENLEQALHKLDTPALREVYKAGQFPRASLVQDPDKRYPIQELYAYLNDDHIDTALRKIVKPL